MIDAILTLWERGGTRITIKPECERIVLQQMNEYMGTDGYSPSSERDSILCLSTIADEPYRVLTSQVTSWRLSTRTSRKLSRAIEAAIEQEEKDDAAARAAPEPATERAT